MNKWNEEQREAIDVREGNFLISASAGSGKTAVLTERVYQILKEGNTKLDEFLILTFTNLAAQHMKDKIREKLLADGNVRLAAQLDAVNIQTFDAFALFIVQKYYYKIGLTSDINLVDESIFNLKKSQFLDEIFDNYYENDDKIFRDLICSYCQNDDEHIKRIVLKVYDSSNLALDKAEMMNNYKDHYLSDEFINEKLDGFVKNTRSIFANMYHLAKTFENVDYGTNLANFLEPFLHFIDYDDYFNAFSNPNIKFPIAKKNSFVDFPDDKIKKDKISDSYKRIKGRFSVSKQEMTNIIKNNKTKIELIVDIANKLDHKLSEFKKEHGVYTFNDIFKFAIDIAKIEEVNLELKNQFKYIMLDEYQDTSDLQEYFISLIANNNIYAVGDVKQSIYRFRNANPEIFLKKFDDYGSGKGGTRIDLPINYRSSSEVLDLVNRLFIQLLTKEESGLNYELEHIMIAGRGSVNSAKKITRNHSNESINYTLGPGEKAAEKEAKLIATDIIKRVEEKEEVFDKDTQKFRSITYGDFAILTLTKTDYQIFQKVFEDFNIPLYANYKQSIHESDLTLTIENIIKALTNIEDVSSNSFRHSLMSILRSFLFSKDEEYIEDLLYRNNYLNDEAYKILIKTKEEIKDKTLKETIITIINNFNFYEKIITLGNVSSSLEFINLYISLAGTMDNLNYSLEDFSNYFIELEKYNIEQEYSSSTPISNSVQLMSIHASKGLEFKYVYLALNYKTFNLKDSSEGLNVSNEYGIALANYENSNPHNLVHYLIKDKEDKETILEELRVFYVALTRAEEKLIIMINTEKYKNQKYSALECRNFLDFISVVSPHFFSNKFEIASREKIDDKVENSIKKLTILDNKKMSEDITIKTKASKNINEDEIDPNLLALGNKYHYYLELVDFSTKNTDFIKSKKDREIIDKFLANPLFCEPGLLKTLHEYSFYDEENDLYGIIDLLLIYEDHINIVDFKLSNVDDVEYEKQVNVYRNYISKISALDIKTFIVGILSNKIKEVI